MSEAIGSLFNVKIGDKDGQVQATAVSLMHKDMVRKMGSMVFGVKPNKRALKLLALDDDQIVEFLSSLSSSPANASGTLLEDFSAMIAKSYTAVSDKAPGLFLYMYLMHDKDTSKKILSKLAEGVDMRALGADLETFFNANIGSDTPDQILSKATAVIKTFCAEAAGSSEPVEVKPLAVEPVAPRVVKPLAAASVKVQARDCTAAYFTDDIVEEFRTVVGLEKTLDPSKVAQLLLSMYLPEKVTETTGFISLARKLRLRPHHVQWARTYANHHPELSSHCWQSIADSIGADAQTQFVRRMADRLRLPCYASHDDRLISAMAMTQFNYMSIIATRLRTTTVVQDRHFRSMRASYMNNVPVDELCEFFDSIVLPVRA